jgi:hypothetical protein
VDKVVAKGKTRPLELLEVRHPYSPDNFDEIARLYNAALIDYERGDFATAEEKFAALRDDQHDKPSALMTERCRELQRDPPSQWNGIYELKTK